jgi:hypothetical protein
MVTVRKPECFKWLDRRIVVRIVVAGLHWLELGTFTTMTSLMKHTHHQTCMLCTVGTTLQAACWQCSTPNYSSQEQQDLAAISPGISQLCAVVMFADNDKFKQVFH